MVRLVESSVSLSKHEFPSQSTCESSATTSRRMHSHLRAHVNQASTTRRTNSHLRARVNPASPTRRTNSKLKARASTSRSTNSHLKARVQQRRGSRATDSLNLSERLRILAWLAVTFKLLFQAQSTCPAATMIQSTKDFLSLLEDYAYFQWNSLLQLTPRSVYLERKTKNAKES